MDQVLPSRRLARAYAPSFAWQRRRDTYDQFCTAFKNRKADELPLLLLDSEDAVTEGDTTWQHLKKRDQMDRPKDAADHHAYLMAQVMETWLLADPAALQTYFKSKFKADKIPAWTAFESVPKQTVYDTLSAATAECGEKQYNKGKSGAAEHSFNVLGLISPEKVKQKCPHAKRLLDFLAQ
ncbi:MAG: DUF4276 family protein [Saprospiraceae bacterium]